MKEKAIKIIEWTLRINVFLKLLNYGIGKIIGHQFHLKGAIPEEIGNISLAQTSGYHLVWTFFGYSKGYILFIGISQIIGAVLFLLPRTKLIGGALLIPILLNIIVVDYFFGVAYGALFSACFYLATILWVFYLNKVQIVNAIQQLIIKRETPIKKQHTINILLIGLAIVAVFFIEYYFIAFFGYDDRI
jgi:hypothetical protein